MHADHAACEKTRAPFIPFRVTTSSGDHHEVLRPDMVMVGKDSLIVGTASEEDPTMIDNMYQVPMAHIVAVNDLAAPK